MLKTASDDTLSVGCSKMTMNKVIETDTKGLQQVFDTKEVSELALLLIQGKKLSPGLLTLLHDVLQAGMVEGA